MTIITVQIDDQLQGLVDEAIDWVRELLEEYLDDNPDVTETPDLGNDLDHNGEVHEIIDGIVPIYTKDIKDIMYLHGEEVEEAFDNAGIGGREDDCWPSGWKAAAIYCYIEEQVRDWYWNEADNIFEEWLENQKDAEEEA